MVWIERLESRRLYSAAHAQVPENAGSLTATLTASGSLSIIPATSFELKETVAFTAVGGAVSGKIPFELLLPTNPSDSSAGYIFARDSIKVHLKENKTKSFSVKLPNAIWRGIDSGDYDILMQITEPEGNSLVTDSGQVLTVIDAACDLAPSFANVPVPLKAGKKTHITLGLSNSPSANYAPDASLPISIFASPDGEIDNSTVVASFSKNVYVKPGDKIKIGVNVTVSANEKYLTVAIYPGDPFPDTDSDDDTCVEPIVFKGHL